MAEKRIINLTETSELTGGDYLVVDSASSGTRKVSGSVINSAIGEVASDLDTLSARVDQIIAPSGEAPSAAEVSDARVGADGVTYPTLGGAIRTQVTDLKDDIDNIEDEFYRINLYNPNSSRLVTGKFIAPDGTINSSGTWCYLKVKVISGKKLTIKHGENNLRIFTCYYDSNGNVVSGGKDRNYNEVITIPNNVVEIAVSALTATREGIMLSYCGYLYPPFTAYGVTKLSENVIKDGYTVITASTSSLRSVLESISDNSAYNKYLILLPEGTYNISSLYTSDEKSSASFYGLFVPNYVKLLGVGNKENVIIKWEESSMYPYVSPINLRPHSELENLTVYCKNGRYAVHDDWGDQAEESDEYREIRSIKNCVFKADGTYLSAAYGMGTYSGVRTSFENCTFSSTINGDTFYMHNIAGSTQTPITSFENCRFNAIDSATIAVDIMSLNTGVTVDDVVEFRGCKSNKIVRLGENNASAYGAGIKFKVTGYANSFPSVAITNTDGVDYSGNIDLI